MPHFVAREKDQKLIPEKISPHSLRHSSNASSAGWCKSRLSDPGINQH